jgi:hypothetical protein
MNLEARNAKLNGTVTLAAIQIIYRAQFKSAIPNGTSYKMAAEAVQAAVTDEAFWTLVATANELVADFGTKLSYEALGAEASYRIAARAKN